VNPSISFIFDVSVAQSSPEAVQTSDSQNVPKKKKTWFKKYDRAGFREEKISKANFIPSDSSDMFGNLSSNDSLYQKVAQNQHRSKGSQKQK